MNKQIEYIGSKIFMGFMPALIVIVWSRVLGAFFFAKWETELVIITLSFAAAYLILTAYWGGLYAQHRFVALLKSLFFKSKTALSAIEERLMKRIGAIENAVKELEKDVEYNGQKRKLAELDISFFLDSSVGAGKQVLDAYTNIRLANGITKNLMSEVEELGTLTEKEELVLRELLEISVQGTGQEKLQESLGRFNDNAPNTLAVQGQTNRTKQIFDELEGEEQNLLKKQFEANKKILEAIVEFKKTLQADPVAMEEAKKYLTLILEAKKKEELREKIPDNLRNAKKITWAILNNAKKQRQNLFLLANIIQTEKSPIMTKLDSVWKKIEERMKKERGELIGISELETRGADLLLPVLNREGVTEAIEIRTIAGLVANAKHIDSTRFSAQDARGIGEFVRRFKGGERLAARIEREVTKDGQEGVKQLDDVLRKYFIF